MNAGNWQIVLTDRLESNSITFINPYLMFFSDQWQRLKSVRSFIFFVVIISLSILFQSWANDNASNAIACRDENRWVVLDDLLRKWKRLYFLLNWFSRCSTKKIRSQTIPLNNLTWEWITMRGGNQFFSSSSSSPPRNIETRIVLTINRFFSFFFSEFSASVTIDSFPIITYWRWRVTLIEHFDDKSLVVFVTRFEYSGIFLSMWHLPRLLMHPKKFKRPQADQKRKSNLSTKDVKSWWNQLSDIWATWRR